MIKFSVQYGKLKLSVSVPAALILAILFKLL